MKIFSSIAYKENIEFFYCRSIKNGPRARRGRAVQRAPSRLYRTVNGPARSFNKTQCIGPEFVVRANQPAKVLTIGEFKVIEIQYLYKYKKFKF